jgi:hypothetical protein
MTTHNNWIESNIHLRLDTPTIDYEVFIRPYPFKEMGFHEAADYTAKLIYEKHKKIYVALSGGADSDFVLRCFHRNGISVEPIIVKTSGNNEEMRYAFKACKELDITPTVLELNDAQYLKIYFDYIMKKIRGYGIFSVPGIHACEYAKRNDGVLVIGEHLLEGEKPDESGAITIRPASNEWDFYNECFVGKEYNIPFFMYTIELIHAMTKAIHNHDTVAKFKCDLYGVEQRPIMSYQFSEDFMRVAARINMARKKVAKPNFSLGTREEFLQILEQKMMS